MNLYAVLVSLHVIAAVLGLGPLVALAVIASSPALALALPTAQFARLLRLVAVGLAVLLVTGVATVALTRGALGETGWMRVSFGLFLVLGFLLSRARRQVRLLAAAAPTTASPAALGRVLWTMCALVAVIAWLMEAKPF